jgi:hypothetical protein
VHDLEFRRQRHAERVSELAADYQQPWPTMLRRIGDRIRQFGRRLEPAEMPVDEAFWTELDARFRERQKREWKLLDALIEQDDRFLVVMFHLAFAAREIAYSAGYEQARAEFVPVPVELPAVSAP